MKNQLGVNLNLFTTIAFLILVANLSAQINVVIFEARILPLNVQVLDIVQNEDKNQKKAQMITFSEFNGDNLLLYFKGKIENRFESKIGLYLSEITMDFKCCSRFYKIPVQTCMTISENGNSSKDSILVINPKESLNINFANFLSLNYCPTLSPLTVKKIIRKLNSRFFLKFKFINVEKKEIFSSKLRIKNIQPFFLESCVSTYEDRSICSIIFEIESQKSGSIK